MPKNTQIWLSDSSLGLKPECEYGSAKVNECKEFITFSIDTFH